jgi:hypothetical protein
MSSFLGPSKSEVWRKLSAEALDRFCRIGSATSAKPEVKL